MCRGLKINFNTLKIGDTVGKKLTLSLRWESMKRCHQMKKIKLKDKCLDGRPTFSLYFTGK